MVPNAKNPKVDHGYLWRMNSYWRYQEVKGGVIVECESLTLSRSIPSLLEYMIRPLIKSVARESMKRTLESFRIRLVRTSQDAGQSPAAALQPVSGRKASAVVRFNAIPAGRP
jgi:hypothetical protein